MKKISMILLLATIVANAYSQKIITSDYDWNEKHTWHNLTAQEEKESYVYLQDYQLFEYFIGDNDLYMYQTFHYIVHLSDGDAVDQFNKVYIQYNNSTDIINIKARTYNKDGKVTYFDRNNIKEAENLEDMGAYKLFTLDAVEVGNEVEIFYTLKKKASMYGIAILQRSIPSRDVLFQICSPKWLIFSTRLQNGTAVRSDSISGERRFVSYYLDSVPALKEEEYASYKSSRLLLDYKYSYNEEKNKTEKYTWDAAAQDVYKFLYNDYEDSEKKLKKVIAPLKLDGLSEEEKIKAVEKYVKTNFTVQDFQDDVNYLTVDFILKNKATSELGLVKFFALLYRAAGIEHQAVCLTSRNRLNISKDYFSWSYLDEYLIYFPGTGKFLSPTNTVYRYPMFPFNLMDNYALFINTIEIGGIYSALPELKKIPITNVEDSHHNTYATVNFTNDLSSITVEHTQSLKGYSGLFIQPYYKDMKDEDRKKLVNEIISSISEDLKAESFEVQNSDPDVAPLKDPFILKVNFTTGSLIEQAGPNIILKVGRLIGKQSELYPNEKRQLPVDVQFPHSLYRTLTINIPEGYRMKGNDGVESHKTGNNMIFESKIRTEGNKVIIDIKEEYSSLTYPKSEFEDFRTVLNSAADFYNSVIILEKVN